MDNMVGNKARKSRCIRFNECYLYAKLKMNINEKQWAVRDRSKVMYKM